MARIEGNVTYADFGQKTETELGNSENTSTRSHQSIKATLSYENDYLPAVDTKDLYPELDTSSSELHTAFRLLDDLSSRLSESITFLREDNVYESDDCINRVIALLPELFCCRSIGDGFSSIIVAINHSIQNKNGTALTEKELGAIMKVSRRLATEPFISFEEALNQVILLEDCGLVVEPEAFSNLLVDENE